MAVSEHLYQDILVAFACGDALGMGTEFMTRDAIEQTFGMLEHCIEQNQSQNHGDLIPGSVTDDTEQNVYLLRSYLKEGKVTVEGSVRALLAWINETDAVAKKYIGPSSLKALHAIESGADYHTTGLSGTTCGGIMRTLAPVLYASKTGVDKKTMETYVYHALIATHNTSQALEAAMAYASALKAAIDGDSFTQILEKAKQGALDGLSLAPYVACAASTSKRIAFYESFPALSSLDDTAFLDFLYGVNGSGLESVDVASCVFALFIREKQDAWKAIRMASSLGGDTDTIAALTGALCVAYAGKSNIPSSFTEQVCSQNHLGRLL